MRKKNWLVLSAAVLAAAVSSLALAQQPAPGESGGPPGQELRDAMRQYLHDQLRMELALSDEQMAQLSPLIERIEDVRSEARRNRGATLRELRQGIRQGAGDEQLQALLDRLQSIEDEQRAAERSAMSDIDAMLTVRQRVQFRFFIQRFRQELQRRVQQLRRDRMGGPPGPGLDDGEPPPGRRP
jgi:Spy/CpxP family protein refolding chaperone